MSISFAPHVLIGYSDLGCIGSRFLLALSPISSGDDEDQKIVLQKIDALSYDRVTKLSYQPPAFQPDNTDATNDEKTEHVPAAPVSVFHYGRRNERPVVSVA